ncbi:glutaminase [Klebsiella pneumoniae]|nr:glutaminase [Klebsiella pneumoniae]
MATVINNAMLEAILAEIRPLIGRGKVADYIPALASVSGDKLGIAISTVDGQHFAAGDAHERFSIQSISKVLSLVVAMNHYQEEEIWQRVGKDPSGQPFNSLLQLEIHDYYSRPERAGRSGQRCASYPLGQPGDQRLRRLRRFFTPGA